ncbi:MAG: acetate uptake transporter [Candidatus Altiarchaeota archaeon]|nr:acetate uptake transporter [Candidatus Altiarchaeota archaeon]
MVEEHKMEVKDNTANPAPLGLMGFGMTTVLLNLHNAGLFKMSAMILAMGVFYGGIAQIIAGIMEWKKKNTFGTTAFTSYGLFWLTLVALVIAPNLGIADKPDVSSMAAYLVMWGLFTLYMFVGTLKLNKSLQAVFGSLTLLFFLLAIGEYVPIAHTIAGYEGILCGFSAIYAAMAHVLNDVYGKKVLPL